jgi:DHA1 family tetracycline resistance protein-like MFS transporter
MGTWFFGAIVMPSTNALMSHRVASDAQGELQGAVASLYSLSSIVGPPLMTQLFGRFSAPDAPVYLPGAAFIASTLLATTSLLIYWWTTRERAGAAATASYAA